MTHYVSKKRRPKEDGRFITGRGKFVADIKRPGMTHVAMVQSPVPSARLKSIDTSRALALPGVLDVITGEELAAHTRPHQNALDTPEVVVYPMAVDRVRFAGEWVAAVVATSRHIAEDAAELVDVDYELTDFVVDPEQAMLSHAPLVHEAHGSNILLSREFVWGPVDDDAKRSEHKIGFRVRWGRNATVPIETFGVVAQWDEGSGILDIWASIQMPSYAESIAAMLDIPLNTVRAHYDVDVGGSYGVKRGLKHTIVAAYLSRKHGVPVRYIEDRLENMTGGEMHGPDRIFDMTVAFDDDGTINSLGIVAIDDAGANSSRGPLQLGKPVSAICGPYRINSVYYHAISVATNKSGQSAVRGFGQSPTNVAIEACVDRVARFLNLDRLEVRRRNLVKKDEFPWRIPSGSSYDSGDYLAVVEKAVSLSELGTMGARVEQARSQGLLSGIGVVTTLEPGGGNSSFEPLLNPKNTTTTWPESCVVKMDRTGLITAMITTSTSGQGHQTLVATIIGEELRVDPDSIRVVHLDTLTGMPGNTPVASRMAIMLGGAASGAAGKLKTRLATIAAHALDTSPDQLELIEGGFRVAVTPAKSITFAELAIIAHREDHRMPANLEPGLQETFVMQVPTGGELPTPDGVVQMYPCYSFACHICRVEIDPATGKTHIPEYVIAHDCGTVINPDIVRGMVIGGAAHGIGAALYEKFEYNEDGQLLTGSFADYLIPSALEIPDIKLDEHCTPSPHTSHGQKGVGEGGYLGAPAAIACAVNDALVPLGLERWELPLRMGELADQIAGGQTLGNLLGP